MKSFSRDSSFVPQGCSSRAQDSVTLGAGVNWGEAYEFAHEQNVTLVGGAYPQVGASGGWLLVRSPPHLFTQVHADILYLQGGGHSPLSPAYGLGVDNLLQAEIITSDGKLQTISECSNPDLFWAVSEKYLSKPIMLGFLINF